MNLTRIYQLLTLIDYYMNALNYNNVSNNGDV